VANRYAESNVPMDRRHPSRMTVRQRFYLVEVLAGLRLTGVRFFANMWRHTLHAVGIKAARGAVTIQYPEERRPYPPQTCL